MSEAFTVTKMLDNINKSMGMEDGCTNLNNVTLKKKVDNGILMDITPQEVAYLDTKAKIRHSAMEVSRLQNDEEREIWMREQKKLGNEAFDRKEYLRAADIYLQALTGMTNAKPAVSWMIDYQLQLTCNLAACMLMTKQWHKAKLMCDNALALKSTHVKALQQRAKALVRLNQFHIARCDLVKALQINKDEGDDNVLRERLQSQMCDLERAKREEIKRSQSRMQFDTNMMHKAVGKLYDDKPQTVRNKALPSQKQPLFTSFGIRVVISIGFFFLALEVLQRELGENS